MSNITADNLLRALPEVLANDESMRAVAAAIAETLEARTGEIETLMIYARIDALPEPLLDMLAYDFKVDWWDANYTVEEKRATLKESWAVHRTLGTKAAVKKAISAISPNTDVAEWFEYGGEPYHFRLLIQLTGERAAPEKFQRVLERVMFYKNLRSWLDEVIYTAPPIRVPLTVTGATFSGVMRTTLPAYIPTHTQTSNVRVGAVQGAATRTKLPKYEGGG